MIRKARQASNGISQPKKSDELKHKENVNNRHKSSGKENKNLEKIDKFEKGEKQDVRSKSHKVQ